MHCVPYSGPLRSQCRRGHESGAIGKIPLESDWRADNSIATQRELILENSSWVQGIEVDYQQG